MLMACHLDGIHPGNAIITMPAVATCILFGTHAVDKPRLIEQSACHLHSLEAVIQHLIYLVPGNQATHITNGIFKAARNFKASSRK